MAAGRGRGAALAAAGLFPSGTVSVLLAVLAAVQAAGLIPLGLALRDRLKEITGGELYEARQY